MFSGASLVFAIVFGLIGSAYLMYGRRQNKWVPILTGLGLIAYPYFVSNPFAVLGIGVALMFVPLWLGD
jgi:hypothetical protein